MKNLKIIIFSIVMVTALMGTVWFAVGIKYAPGQVMVSKTLPTVEYRIQIHGNNYVTTTNKKVAQYLSAVLQENTMKMNFYLDTFTDKDKEEAKNVMYQVMEMGFDLVQEDLSKKELAAKKLLGE